MRILHINDYAYPIGGAETYLGTLINAQIELGNRVSLLSSDSLGGGTLSRFPDPENTLVQTPIFTQGTSSSFRPLRALFQLYNTSALRAAKQVVDNFRPDIVHVHMYLGQLSPSVLNPFLNAGIPIIHTSHTYRSVCPKGDRMLIDHGFCRLPVGRACIRNCSKASYLHMQLRERLHPRPQTVFAKVIAPGATMAETLEREGFSDVVLLPYGSTFPVLDQPRTVPAKPVVLYVGRMSRNKGVDILIRAFRKIADAIPDASLRLAGGGPEQKSLEQLAKHLLPANSYEFLGLLNADQVKTEQQSSRIQCIPSVWPDNSPLVVYEALSSGVPLVASAVGGIPDLVHSGKEGVLVPPGNANALAQAAIRLLADDTQWRRMMRASLKRGRDLGMSTHAERIDEIYQDCLQKKRDS